MDTSMVPAVIKANCERIRPGQEARCIEEVIRCVNCVTPLLITPDWLGYVKQVSKVSRMLLKKDGLCLRDNIDAIVSFAEQGISIADALLPTGVMPDFVFVTKYHLHGDCGNVAWLVKGSSTELRAKGYDHFLAAADALRDQQQEYAAMCYYRASQLAHMQGLRDVVWQERRYECARNAFVYAESSTLLKAAAIWSYQAAQHLYSMHRTTATATQLYEAGELLLAQEYADNQADLKREQIDLLGYLAGKTCQRDWMELSLEKASAYADAYPSMESHTGAANAANLLFAVTSNPIVQKRRYSHLAAALQCADSVQKRASLHRVMGDSARELSRTSGPKWLEQAHRDYERAAEQYASIGQTVPDLDKALADTTLRLQRPRPYGRFVDGLHKRRLLARSSAADEP